MIVVFVHGWSVRHTDAYGDLPRWLEQQGATAGSPIKISDVFLGKYVSFRDEVTVDDLARAFDQALTDAIGPQLKKGDHFAGITHSTGGPVVRKWIDLFYKGKLAKCPLDHLIMLTPANHGSALAQLGKSKLARMKFFSEGLAEGQTVEPGERVLDWLELGSDESWELNESWLDYECAKDGLYPFVLTGQTIERSFYDNLNSYTDEPGSDGVVRVTAANMNYTMLRLKQVDGKKPDVERERFAARMALGILPGLAHSGDKIGIVRSVQLTNADTHPTAHWVWRCLRVDSTSDYNRITRELEEVSKKTQDEEREREDKVFFILPRKYTTSRYSMIIFRLVDDRGHKLDDYDLYLTAGPQYDPNHLPQGFFVDRQRNQKNLGKLTYYLDYHAMVVGLNQPGMEQKIGFRVVARPERGGLAYYEPFEFQTSLSRLAKYFEPNQTLMMEIQLLRKVDKTAFRLTDDLNPGPISGEPSSETVA